MDREEAQENDKLFLEEFDIVIAIWLSLPIVTTLLTNPSIKKAIFSTVLICMQNKTFHYIFTNFDAKEALIRTKYLISLCQSKSN